MRICDRCGKPAKYLLLGLADNEFEQGEIDLCVECEKALGPYLEDFLDKPGES